MWDWCLLPAKYSMNREESRTALRYKWLVAYKDTSFPGKSWSDEYLGSCQMSSLPVSSEQGWNFEYR